MNLFYLLLCLMILGAGAIAFILIMEKNKGIPTDGQPSVKPQTSPHEILNRLGIDNLGTTKPNVLPEPFKKTVKEPPTLLEDPLKAPVKIISIPSAAAPTTDTKAESEISLKYDELQTKHEELQERFTKLEEMFTEKSGALEKLERNLTNELKNQKEFNKIKDLLEKELKDNKDKAKGLQSDVTNAETEAQTYFKRITQLEEKVKKLELDLLTSEAAINDAQAGTSLARKHAEGLEAKLRANENIILEKNQKIEDLVTRLNISPTTTELPVSPQEVPVPEGLITETSAVIPESVSNVPVLEPPTIVPEPSVVILEPPPPDETVIKEGGIEETHTTAKKDAPPAESLSLPPDIFSSSKQEEPPTEPDLEPSKEDEEKNNPRPKP